MTKDRMTINTLTLIVALAALVMAGGVLVGCTPPTASGGNNEMQNTISVNGHGEAMGSPDVAYVNLGVSIRGNDLGEAIEEANRIAADITGAVTEMGIASDDVQTRNFNVSTEERRDDSGDLTGQVIYRVSNNIRVTVRDITMTSDVIGAGLDAGANQVNNLDFGIEDQDALVSTARAAAVADARQRAEELAEGLGVRVGNPISISESGGGMPVSSRNGMDMAFAEAAAGAAPAISSGQLSVNLQVYVVFELLP